MKRKKHFFSLLALIVVVAAILLHAGYKKVERFADQTLAIKQDRVFTLPAGIGRHSLEALLVQDNVIKDSHIFPWLLRLEPKLAEFKAGTYLLTREMTLREMLQLFSSGKEAQFTVRFVEGSHLSDWWKILQQSEYLKHELNDKSAQELAEILGIKETDTLEGWLYPDTYHYTAGTSDVALLKRAYRQMKMTLEEEWQKRDKNLPYKSAYEMLIMASIIEKETAVEAERTKVASVFINRLRLNMRLQTDPTVIYGLGEKYTGTIFRKDLTTLTPYNTYMINGLPPTPIAMPGLASIKAAAHPAKTEFLYFVADGKGGHTFTTNLAAHNRAVNIYRQGLRQSK
ncbi:endolytic transglycosylase MltG [Photorhabdus tasmaniensis]|uniref:Endolytic murein transglycosylase n=1 Tax=Photorhabdus tasmaniensis TaxID=1004159 RepID=A0ABX0GIE3_9GAMM|nr:endolytic transglycosylase MltG [Photorhabdus tasmaniensis]NHB88287.1 endolytic transglycosylase MltG [Photorhabdus tasmaniensis]